MNRMEGIKSILERFIFMTFFVSSVVGVVLVSFLAVIRFAFL